MLPPGELPHPGIKLESPAAPALSGRFFITEPSGKPIFETREFKLETHRKVGHELKQEVWPFILPGNQLWTRLTPSNGSG